MRVLSASGSRGNVAPGLAVRFRSLGGQVRVCAPPDFAELPRRLAGLAAAAEGCDALVATGAMTGGVRL